MIQEFLMPATPSQARNLCRAAEIIGISLDPAIVDLASQNRVEFEDCPYYNTVVEKIIDRKFRCALPYVDNIEMYSVISRAVSLSPQIKHVDIFSKEAQCWGVIAQETSLPLRLIDDPYEYIEHTEDFSNRLIIFDDETIDRQIVSTIALMAPHVIPVLSLHSKNFLALVKQQPKKMEALSFLNMVSGEVFPEFRWFTPYRINDLDAYINHFNIAKMRKIHPVDMLELLGVVTDLIQPTLAAREEFETQVRKRVKQLENIQASAARLHEKTKKSL